MITGIYFLLLLAAAVEDYRTHTVGRYRVLGVYVLGLCKILLQKENRWVTVTLTCVCFVLLYLLYQGVKRLAERTGRPLLFGGADVRLIPGMMLVQGWAALSGVFAGLLTAFFFSLPPKRRRKEIPLVPWMVLGCFFVEIVYLFSEKSML